MTTRSRLKVPSDRNLCVRVLLETLAVFTCSIPLIYWHIVQGGDYEPFQRGFFCDDESLKHPYVEEQISVGMCALIWIIAVLAIVITVEVLTAMVYDFPLWSRAVQKSSNSCRSAYIARIPRAAIETYRILGYFAVGALFCTLTTELAKWKIGRLRPYFLTVCAPDLNDDLCKDAHGYNVFVANYTCSVQADAKMVREAKKSFLSGHSSFSFYCATFIIVYLHARLSRDHQGYDENENRKCLKIVLRGIKILRPFIQFACFAGALFIALSRITDYRHHPTDVIVGILVGLSFAAIILLFLADLFNRPRSFQVRDPLPYDLSDVEDQKRKHRRQRSSISLSNGVQDPGVPLAPLARSDSSSSDEKKIP